jgi:hypothetical protein
MENDTTTPKNIDEYIVRFPDEVQVKLKKLRRWHSRRGEITIIRTMGKTFCRVLEQVLALDSNNTTVQFQLQATRPAPEDEGSGFEQNGVG